MVLDLSTSPVGLPPTLDVELADAAMLKGLEASYFLLRRQIARKVLAQVTSRDAASIKLRNTEFGKPYCHEFNLGLSFSHRGSLSAIGVAGSAIGVDIESSPLLGDIPWRMLSHAERANLNRIEEMQRGEAFLRLWTLKEAVVKALGRGFPDDPEAISILDDSVAPRLAEGGHGHMSLASQVFEFGAGVVHVGAALRTTA